MAYSQVALSPDGGASWHLTRAIGRAKALELLWLGEHQTAQQWHALGLVQRMVPAGTALSNALALADQLAGVAPGVISSIKELVNDAPDQSLSTHLAAEKQHFMRNLVQPAAGQAIESFLQNKRR
jgi:enoyl-CoA hydratase/carnithine racemase